jgi:hypothetical protein
MNPSKAWAKAGISKTIKMTANATALFCGMWLIAPIDEESRKLGL